MGYHKFIHDEDEIKKFVSILAVPKADESYFVSMSARNKYLTQEERVIYSLGRTEMFARKLVKPSTRVSLDETYLRVLKSLQVSYGGYTSRSGIIVPDKCLVCYANVNPSSGIKALKEFQGKMLEALFDMRTNSNAPSNFVNLDSQLMNCYQRNRGEKYWIDIDFDIPPEGIDILEKFLEVLKRKEVTYYIIETRSGYHVLMRRDSVRFNYTDEVLACHFMAEDRFGEDHIEVTVNSNGMVPVPGTMQAGFPVRFIDV